MSWFLYHKKIENIKETIKDNCKRIDWCLYSCYIFLSICTSCLYTKLSSTLSFDPILRHRNWWTHTDIYLKKLTACLQVHQRNGIWIWIFTCSNQVTYYELHWYVIISCKALQASRNIWSHFNVHISVSF